MLDVEVRLQSQMLIYSSNQFNFVAAVKLAYGHDTLLLHTLQPAVQPSAAIGR